MFDWGLYQLEKFFETYPFDDLDIVRAREGQTAPRRTIESSVSYDWDRNRLIIRFYISMIKKESEKYAKDLCYSVTEKIRKSFLFDEYQLKSFAGLSRFFRHKGFSLYKDEKDRNNHITEIEKVICIDINVSFRNPDASYQLVDNLKTGIPSYKNILICESPLLGKDIYYVDGK